ncbi:DUF1289 domain-containing protein [Janthinobacterium sp.]|uniref:DUF1289 domain-containing protein n=1 Tax=Janthinobacterium sp. TaxID=1871054 RepID=UPI00293D43A6|nr:DUF1289 domain-containing protein [Janthinobacterium sp.]
MGADKANPPSAMSPDFPPEAPVPSPCVSLCKMDPDSGLCEGCLRTLDEIVQWSAAGEDFKRAVWVEIRRREQQIQFD